jgi:AcrR family transcriptional regulator
VLEAAIRLADEGGIESLTMRKLARALGVEAMSLYNHVANKGDLVDGIVDLAVSEIDLPSTATDWEAAGGLGCPSKHAGRRVDDVGADLVSPVSVLLELRNDWHRTNGLPVEDKAVTGAPYRPVIGGIANVALKGREGLSALKGQTREAVLNSHNALPRIEVEPVRKPVVGIDVIETERFQA